MRSEPARVIALLATAILLLGSPGAAGQVATPTAPTTTVKVAFVTLGLVSNYGWDAAGYQGLMRAKDRLGIEVAFQENVADADVERVMRDFAARGYNLIFGHSFSYGDAIFRVAADYPDVAFMWANGDRVGDNVSTYLLKSYEAFYLTGILAARMTKTNTIGTIGGFEIPSVIEIHEAYKAGARSAKPDVEVLEAFTGSWYDAVKGREAAMAMIDAEADVIRHEGEGYGLGVLKAVEESGGYTISSMTDQNVLAPDTVLTSVTWDISPYVEAAVKEVSTGSFRGQVWDWGMKEGLVDLAPYHGLSTVIPQAVQEEIAATKEKILTGELVVPRIRERQS